MDAFSLLVKANASRVFSQSEDHLWNRSVMAKSQSKIKAFSIRFNEVLVDKGWQHLPDSELCKKFRKGNTTVWNWKNAVKMPAIETAIDIAIVLDVCVDWLLTGRGRKHPDVSTDDDDDNGGLHLDISGLPHGQQVHLRALVHSIQEQGSGKEMKINDE